MCFLSYEFLPKAANTSRLQILCPKHFTSIMVDTIICILRRTKPQWGEVKYLPKVTGLWGRGQSRVKSKVSAFGTFLSLPRTCAAALELQHTSSIALIGLQAPRTAVASTYKFHSRSCRKCLVWANTDWRDDKSLTSFRLFPLEEASRWTKPRGKHQGCHYYIHSTLRWPAPNSSNETLPAPPKTAMSLPDQSPPSLRGHHSPDSHLG